MYKTFYLHILFLSVFFSVFLTNNNVLINLALFSMYQSINQSIN